MRIHSMASPGLVSSLDVRFSAPGEVTSDTYLFFLEFLSIENLEN